MIDETAATTKAAEPTSPASDTALLPKVETPPTGKPRTRLGPLLTLAALKEEYRQFVMMAYKHLCGTHADSEGWMDLLEEDLTLLRAAIKAGSKELPLVNELAQNIATYSLALAAGATLTQDELTTASRQTIRPIEHTDIVYLNGQRYRLTKPNVRIEGDRVVHDVGGPNHRVSYSVLDAIKEGLLRSAPLNASGEEKTITPAPTENKPVAASPLATRSLFCHEGKWYRFLAAHALFNFKTKLLEHKDAEGTIHAYALSAALGLSLVALDDAQLAHNQFEHVGGRYELVAPNTSFKDGFVREKRGQSELTCSVADALRTNKIKRM